MILKQYVNILLFSLKKMKFEKFKKNYLRFLKTHNIKNKSIFKVETNLEKKKRMVRY